MLVTGLDVIDVEDCAVFARCSAANAFAFAVLQSFVSEFSPLAGLIESVVLFVSGCGLAELVIVEQLKGRLHRDNAL